MTDRISVEEFHRREAATWSEAALQNKIVALAFDLGWKTYHTHDSRRSNPGWPDLALVHPKRGRFMVRELKKQHGSATKEQREWIAALELAGVNVGIWRPLDYLNQTIHRELLL